MRKLAFLSRVREVDRSGQGQSQAWFTGDEGPCTSGAVLTEWYKWQRWGWGGGGVYYL